MKKTICLLGLILFSVIVYCAYHAARKFVSYAAENRQLNQALQAFVDQDRKKYHLPALSFTVNLPDDRINRNFVSGYYTLKKKRKITPNTLFQIGSITKTFTAVMILKLVQMHKLQLHEKLKKLLPQYPKWRNITIRELLNHTSGAFNYIDAKGFWKTLKKHPKRFWTLEKLANLAYKYPVYFKPGKTFRYTNTDYVLLGLVIKKILHQPITSVFDHYLLGSTNYNLNHTFYANRQYPSEFKDSLAHGYDNEGTFGYMKDVTNVSPSFASTAGAIVSTSDDITKWGIQLFLGKILSKKYLAMMESLVASSGPAVQMNVTDFIKHKGIHKNKPWTTVGQGLGPGLVYFKNFGLGWTHSGGMPGYQSLMIYNPCTGVSFSLMYTLNPKYEFTFLKIASDLYRVLNQSALVDRDIYGFKMHANPPAYCRLIN